MLDAGRLIGLLALGRDAAERLLFRRVLSGIAIVVTLTIMAGMLAGALLLGALYGLYVVLVHYGLDATGAAFTVAGIAILCIALLASMTLSYARYALDIPRRFREVENDVFSRFSTAVDAFVDGLLTHPAEPPEAHRGNGASAEPMQH